MKLFNKATAIIFTAITLPLASYAQVWVESVNATSIQFVVRANTGNVTGATGAVAANLYESGAGARFKFTFDKVNAKLTVDVTNLTDNNASGTRTISITTFDGKTSNVSFNAGNLEGFGFETRGTLVPNGFSDASLKLLPASSQASATGSDSSIPATFYAPLTFTHSPDYSVEAGVYDTQNTLESSTTATYVFAFDKTYGYNANFFSPAYFWKGNGNVAGDYDFMAVWSGTENSPQYWDKVAINIDNLPIPEPSTYGLIGAGALVGIAAIRRRRSLASSK